MQTKAHSQDRKKQSKLPLFVSLGVVLVIVGCYFFIPSFQQSIQNAYDVLTSEDQQRIESWVSQFGVLGPLVIVVTMIIQMFLLIIPSVILMVVAVLAYGPWLGILIIASSIFAASSIGYMIGRYLGPVVVDRLIGAKKESKLEFYVERYGYWVIIVTRFSPVLSNDAISFVGGLLRMGYWKFIGATMIGILPLAGMIAYFGQSNEAMKTGLIWVSSISFVLLVIYIFFDNKKRKKAMEEEDQEQPAKSH